MAKRITTTPAPDIRQNQIMPNRLSDHVGLNIKRIREAQLITQSDLAKRIGISAARLCYYENATNSPTVEIVIAIAKELRIGVVALFCNSRETGTCPTCRGVGVIADGRRT
jgi:transcriptional regulator with XRE-family HTH domain